ncbi:GntR family transcriptional regulator [Massilia atriviolacea]|uniref:GntR family transcriptional regulator n=1 Tax=Massilia atriviolacea TaxID=2495579 RepID=A0A430HQP3_9BURK|nr:GntR family transcriptional regulator [Massilia atriviolacea]RSZ59840.1 GntR family transcriptional regulator [Massilia atriviolacea]
MPLSRDNAAPLQQQLADVLRHEIDAGAYEPSGKLPSEAALGARFGVSRVTVRLALARLAEAGVVERKQGKGTYAAGKQVRHGLDQLRSFHESLLAQGLRAEMRLLSQALVALPQAMAELAEAGQGQCLLLQRLHLVDGEPIALGRNYLPPGLAAMPAEKIARQPAYALLAELTGLPVARAELAIRLALADGAVAQALGVGEGSAVLLMERRSYFADGRCCDCSAFYIRPERYAFVLRTSFAPGG